MIKIAVIVFSVLSLAMSIALLTVNIITYRKLKAQIKAREKRLEELKND